MLTGTQVLDPGKDSSFGLVKSKNLEHKDAALNLDTAPGTHSKLGQRHFFLKISIHIGLYYLSETIY